MSEKIIYVLGFVTGLLCVAVIFAIIRAVCKKKNKPTEYDERQVLARGAAYSAAFFSALIYMICCGLLDILEIKWAQVNVQMFLGLFFSIAVFATICIIKDAYFSINSKKGIMAILFGITIAVNIFVIVINIIEGEHFITDGMLNKLCINAEAVIALSEILVVLLVKSIIDRRKVEE